jgi:hypothetical protein
VTQAAYFVFRGVKRDRPVRKADSFTAICEPIAYNMMEPRRLMNLWATAACYKDSLTFLLILCNT